MPTRLLIVLLAWLPLACIAAGSERQRGENLDLTLLSEDDALTPGGRHWLALRIEHDTHWHTYWENPGDSGLPTRIRWTLPDGVTASEIAWPYPKRLPIGPLVNFGYEGETWLLTEIAVPNDDGNLSDTIEIAADVSYLVCREECIPGKATLQLALPVATTTSPDPSLSTGFAAARQRIPDARNDLNGTIAERDGAFEVVLTGPLPSRFDLFPVTESVFATPGFEGWASRGGDSLATLHARSDSFSALPTTVPVVLVDRDSRPARAYSFALTAADGTNGQPVASASPSDPANRLDSASGTPAGNPLSFGWAMLLAFAGGLVLNLMPCVFPVLSMKALHIAQSAGDRPRARREGLFYTIGVLASFAVIGGLLLALRAGGEQIGWGFQLQSPWLVAGLAYLMFALGLSLSGALTIGSGWMNAGQRLAQGHGDRAAFFTGVLACVVAAPCTAPFMGAALGYALTQPPLAAMSVFLALGLGLAAPLAALALMPGIARALPKPGAWMETFKQALAFPMYLTAVWLLWVLALQTGANGVAVALIGLVLVAFGVWLWERSRWTAGSRLSRAAAVVAVLIALALLPVPQRLGWIDNGMASANAGDTTSPQAWSQDALDRLRDVGEPVFVNMTAAWCITCKANEIAALSSDTFDQRLRQHGITYLKGDWTRYDAAITDYLARFGRAGVPLYVIYPRGGGDPVVLPQILTPGAVLQALDRAAGVGHSS